MNEYDVVIIGGGPAGRVIVHALHGSDQQLSVALIKEEETNVNRCAVPYGIDGIKPLEKYQIPNTLVTDFGAELIVARVDAIDPDAETVRTADGQEFRYRHLVIATGSRPLLPPIDGIGSTAVVPVRSLDDLDQLRSLAAAARLKKAVVVGGGYIGVEVAVVLRRMGFEVSIVEMLPRILMQTTEPEFTEPLSRMMTERGIELRTGRRVTAFRESAALSLDVDLDDGSVLPCGFAVMAAGVQLNMELATSAGIETSPLGIVTDEFLRTSHPNIYAAGDCAAKISQISRQPIRGEFGTNAVFMGKVVARNILGNPTRCPGVINANVTRVFDWGIGSAGLTEQMARDAGLDVITGRSRVLDRYPMIDGVSSIDTKLIFDSPTGRLLGGTVMRRGKAVAANVDFLSLAIQKRTTSDDLLIHQYATHPELAAKPSDNAYVFAARDAARAGVAADDLSRA